jgi:hypothetical protein
MNNDIADRIEFLEKRLLEYSTTSQALAILLHSFVEPK